MPAENPLLTQLKQLNEKLTLNQKISILALAAAILTGVGLMVYFMGQEEYQTLYSGLNAEEASTVVNRLKDLKVPYQLTDAGKNIRVPKPKIDELRIQLASEGLPQSGKIGFEIFDKTNLGMTEFLEKISYKRALEGELARTILSLKEVSQARVHLVLPKESLFQEKSEPTKASVVIKLNAGKYMDPASNLNNNYSISNPIARIATVATRTWTDVARPGFTGIAGDNVPQCDFTNNAENGECAASGASTFGTATSARSAMRSKPSRTASCVRCLTTRPLRTLYEPECTFQIPERFRLVVRTYSLMNENMDFKPTALL
jgi:hypothetical protein